MAGGIAFRGRDGEFPTRDLCVERDWRNQPVPCIDRWTLQDKNESIRASAAYALGDIGNAAQEAVPSLIQALRDESSWVRRHATEALGLIGQPVQNTVPALIELLRDEHYWIRDNAARALARLGPAAEAAIPALMDTLNDENRYVRFHATFALKQIGTPKAADVLFDHLLTSRWCPLTTSHSAF